MRNRNETVFGSRQAGLVMTIAGLVMLGSAGAQASSVLGESWSAGDVAGWVAEPADGLLLSNPSDYLRVSFAASDVPPPGQDLIRTGPGAAAGLTGNYVAAGIQAISFRFLAENYAPDGLSVYFASPSRDWHMPLTVSADVGVWTTYQVGFDYSLGWIGGPGADAALFALDLTDVQWIGFSLERTYAGCDAPPAQNYRLDELVFVVPEPETYVLLLAALLPLLVVFHRELRQWWWPSHLRNAARAA